MFGLFLVSLVVAKPVVPVSVQEAIHVHVAPRLGYVPTIAPAGYSYASWMPAKQKPHELSIWFRWRHARDPGLGFNVGDGCPEFGSTMKRFRFGGVTVRWSTTNTNAQAWRCLKRGKRSIYFSVSAPGYMLAGAPSARSVALMIASARAPR